MDNISIRGFPIDWTNTMRRDGMPVAPYYDLPLENTERIDVLKGPSGFLYGVNSPGGTVNYVMKRRRATASRARPPSCAATTATTTRSTRAARSATAISAPLQRRGRKGFGPVARHAVLAEAARAFYQERLPAADLPAIAASYLS